MAVGYLSIVAPGYGRPELDQIRTSAVPLFIVWL